MKTSEDKKKKGVNCCAYGCSNKPVSKLGGLCPKHYQRKRKEVDPVGVRYFQFVGKAKSRNIPCSVSLPEFRHFCKIHNYIIQKGRRGQNATIDRRCNIHGYHLWNMTILSNRANASKGNRFSGNNFDCPF